MQALKYEKKSKKFFSNMENKLNSLNEKIKDFALNNGISYTEETSSQIFKGSSRPTGAKIEISEIEVQKNVKNKNEVVSSSKMVRDQKESVDYFQLSGSKTIKLVEFESTKTNNVDLEKVAPRH
ncbi:MAG: hypothetical protein LBJ09_03505 [Clostridiales bacterium]|jgi:hypothetical protein|nr:hypothetical protein [Clostridiales bacterium]